MQRRVVRVWVLSLTVALCLEGCGHSGAAPQRTAPSTRSDSASVCRPETRTVTTRFLALTPGAISAAASTGNNAMPQCSYTVRLADGKHVVAIANVDTSPQPYFRLERTAIEAAQVFGSERIVPAPQAVTGLGLEADWFPAHTQLMSTDGLRLITVSVSWKGVTQKRQRALAEAVARTYLRKPRGQSGRSLANGFPSG
jgi:hypothetical protein